jgi:hypothetical protein
LLELDPVVLESDALLVRYAPRTFADQASNNVIVDFMLKEGGANQVAEQLDGVWLAYGVGRGPLTRCDRSENGRGARLEWGGGKVVQEVEVFEREPVLRIDYERYGANIVDIGRPGGVDTGEYAIYGAHEWQARRRELQMPEARENGSAHHRLIDDLYPEYPHPLTDRGWNPSPLEYRGWLILGVYDPKTDLGFGRLVPSAAVPLVKLLWNKGFELFPAWGAPSRDPFRSYLFAVRHGPHEIFEVGKRLANGDPR